MTQSRIIKILAGDTEPLSLWPSAGSGLSTLDGIDSIVLYMREKDATENHVDGVACTIVDSATREVSFDPADAKNGGGNAFDAPGVYRGYMLLTQNDGDETRHPGKGEDPLEVQVSANYE